MPLDRLHSLVGGERIAKALIVGRCKVLQGLDVYVFFLDEHMVRCCYEEQLETEFVSFISNPEPWLVRTGKWEYFRKKMRDKKTFMEGLCLYWAGIFLFTTKRRRCHGAITKKWIHKQGALHGFSAEMIDAAIERMRKNLKAAHLLL